MSSPVGKAHEPNGKPSSAADSLSYAAPDSPDVGTTGQKCQPDNALTQPPCPDINDWELARVVGQLLCVSVGHHTDGAYGFSDSVDDVAALISQHHIGGVCYFPVGDAGAQPEEIRRTLATLAASSQTPLLFSIDQEGGLVTRMREPATRWPSAMAVAALADLERTRYLARCSGEELRAVGINHVYAPDADVNSEARNPVIGLRSPSSDPHIVADQVTAAIAGYHDAGLATCVKHFPGHGQTTVDSHSQLPQLVTTREEWERAAVLPFAAAISSGVDAVMIGHLAAPALDPRGGAATFSRPIITDILRTQLGFTGVIITDALDMGGAHLPGSAQHPCVEALAAGVDQLLMPRDPLGAITAIVHAVDCGELDESALRSSAHRIIQLKKRLGLFAEPSCAMQPHTHHTSYPETFSTSQTHAESGTQADEPYRISHSPSQVAPPTSTDVSLNNPATLVSHTPPTAPALNPAAEIDTRTKHSRTAFRAIRDAIAWRERSARFRLDPQRPIHISHDRLPPSIGRGVEDVPAELCSQLSAAGFSVTCHQFDDPIQSANQPSGTHTSDRIQRDTSPQRIVIIRDAWRCDDVAAQVQKHIAAGVDLVICARSPYDSMLIPRGIPTLLTFGDIPAVARALCDVLIAGAALGSTPVQLPTPTLDPRLSASPYTAHNSAGPLSEDTTALLDLQYGGDPRIHIRPYRHADREALGNICIRTGDSGSDATGLYVNEQILPDIYTYPYLEYAPELVHILDVDGQAVGYIVGVANVPDFARWWDTHWIAYLRRRYGLPSAELPARERALIAKGYDPQSMVAPWHTDYPAEFHIDMLPVVQGRNWGSKLIESFRQAVAPFAPGIAIGVGARNTRAVAFYRKLGFHTLHTHESGTYRGYTMGISTRGTL
ncbi:glycoside hydrolase family 3 N-terminal domain-containing protein [Trueperella sp. LYQ141]|uniref:glycoside hydrolase family 3 N-terminal domain-containing protein n=1 Tax=Trueperella sp. LYQ141 TaxID=3391058 RepID=UPI0039832A84